MTTKTKTNQNVITKLGIEKFEWLGFFVTVLSCVTIICLKDMYVANMTYKTIYGTGDSKNCYCDTSNPLKETQK